MNNVCLIGRLTRDIEVRETNSGIKYTSFSLAVQRNYKNADGEYEADFFNCTAWRSSAEFLEKYFAKGSQVGVVGHLQTRKWDEDGTTRYATDIVCDHVYFVGVKKQGNNNNAGADNNNIDSNNNNIGNNNSFDAPEGFTPLNDDDLPF